MKNKILLAEMRSKFRVTNVMKILNPELEGKKVPEFNVQLFSSISGKTHLIHATPVEKGRRIIQRCFRNKYQRQEMNKFLEEFNLKLGTKDGDYVLLKNVYCPFHTAADKLDSTAHDLTGILPRAWRSDVESVLNNLASDLRTESHIEKQ